ncbi:TPA: site-specific integrase [Corynebacterium striatum]|nr:site-specific integrase [Corynebacterium striatum]HAT1158762.1 site-specific integrase [Corynebacterium striatum]HAT1161467.1 site-specific integrase [Corynebacterium striatum]HAT1164210.1 site-specific integrase [Corynebacterium striatum]HAT1166978.1 site-specific integrase [Corynebacterium striatum]
MAVQKRLNKAGKKIYIARWRDPAGKERSKSFSRERAAKAYLQDVERAVRRGEYIEDTGVTVEELVRERVEQATNKSTRNGRRMLLANLGDLGDMPVLSVKPSHVREWMRLLEVGRPWADDRPLATSTINMLAAILHGVFSQAVLDDVVGRHPMRGVKIPRTEVGAERADIPTVEDVRALIESARGTAVGKGSNPTLAAMIQVAAETGLRAGELCGLRVRNVNFLRGEIHVVEQISQRSGDFAPLKTESSRRVVPIGLGTVQVIEEQLRRVPRAPEETVFCTREGRPLSSSSLSARFRTVARRAGVGTTFHGLRHFYASVLIESGASVVMVQRALGHASASMTLDVYSHLFPGAGEGLRGMVPQVRDFCGISDDGEGSSDEVCAGSAG